MRTAKSMNVVWIILTLLMALILFHKSSVHEIFIYSRGYLLILIPYLVFYCVVTYLRFFASERTFFRVLLHPVLLVVYGTLCAIVLGEVVTRVYDFGYVMPSQIAGTGYWTRRPNSEILFQGGILEPRKYVSKLAYNSTRWHDWDYPKKKSPGAKRIIFIGDSWVESRRVEVDKTFHKKIERKLNQMLPGKFEVLAFGERSTAQSRHIHYLKDTALAYDPDLVVEFFFTGNDVENEIPFHNTKDLSSFDRIWLRVREYDRYILSSLIEKGYNFIPFLHARLNDFIDSYSGWSDSYYVWMKKIFDPKIAHAWEAGWSNVFHGLSEMRKIAEQHGVKFLVVGVPRSAAETDVYRPEGSTFLRRETAEMAWKDKGILDFSYPMRHMEEFTKKHNMRFFNLAKAFTRLKPEQVLKMYGDHWTPYGHRVVADVLTDALIPLVDQK